MLEKFGRFVFGRSGDVVGRFLGMCWGGFWTHVWNMFSIGTTWGVFEQLFEKMLEENGQPQICIKPICSESFILFICFLLPPIDILSHPVISRLHRAFGRLHKATYGS